MPAELSGTVKNGVLTILRVMTYKTSQERKHWLPGYLGIYNVHRCHMALGGLPPQQSLQRLLIPE